MNGPKAQTIWLVRHGNREDFVDLDWGRTAVRPHDPGLSADGVEQARAAGSRLKRENLDRIFTSPYLRCAQTAHVIAQETGTRVHAEAGLGELNHPDWTAGLPELLTLSELTRLTSAFDESHAHVHEPVYPETLEHAFARAEKTARAIAARYPGRILLVGHAVSIIGIVRGLAGEQGDLPCPLAGLFCLEQRAVDVSRRGNGPSWVLTVRADTSHLRSGASHEAFRFH